MFQNVDESNTLTADTKLLIFGNRNRNMETLSSTTLQTRSKTNCSLEKSSFIEQKQFDHSEQSTEQPTLFFDRLLTMH